MSRNGKASELFNVLKCLNHKAALYKSQYRNAFGWDIDSTMFDVLNQALKGQYFYVNKHDVLHLKSKHRVKYVVQISDEYEKLYRTKFSKFMKDYYERVTAGTVSGNSMIEYLVELQGLRLALATAKAEESYKLATECLDDKHSVVIFSDFKEPLELIQQKLTKAGIPYIRLTSEDSFEVRYEKQQAFKRKEAKVFLCTFKCGGVGISLVTSDRMIVNDRPYTPADALQAEDRLHRLGQQNQVKVYWMWWGDPSDVEGKIADILEAKQKSVNVLNDYNVSIDFNEVIYV
jgi:SNF2 family DNA or RNA helicase